MNATQWYARADAWQARLNRLRPLLAADDPRNNRIYNRLSRGVTHALQMGALSSRIEHGCGHDPHQHYCDDCMDAASRCAANSN
jgi:hypothetical protein